MRDIMAAAWGLCLAAAFTFGHKVASGPGGTATLAAYLLGSALMAAWIGQRGKRGG